VTAGAAPLIKFKLIDIGEKFNDFSAVPLLLVASRCGNYFRFEFFSLSRSESCGKRNYGNVCAIRGEILDSNSGSITKKSHTRRRSAISYLL
jgi:hypothetical protein